MRERGLVVSTNGLVALVQFAKGKHCEGCNVCQAFGEGSAVLEAKNEVQAKPGDTVEVEIPPKHVLTSSFLVFIVPALTMIAGYLVSNLWLRTSGDASVGAAFLGLLFGFGLVRLYDRAIASRKDCPATIVRKIDWTDQDSASDLLGDNAPRAF